MQGFHIPAAPPLYTNTFLLISDAGHAVVIDPAAEVHSYDEILKQHNATLTTILCTHGHYDHVGSAAALKAEWNAALYCEKADLAGDRMYPLSAADCGYTEGEQIAVDELCFTVWHTPGHTPGHVALYEPDSKSLFTGDTLFRESIGRTDLPGGDYSWIMRSILDSLIPLGEEVHIYPGHGPESTIGHETLYNPFIVEVLNEEINYRN